MNNVYEKEDKKFRRGNFSISPDENFIMVSFHYDNRPDEKSITVNEDLKVKITNILEFKKETVVFNRIMVIYEKNTVHFLKPNKYRYWLNSIAVADADRVFADMVANGH